MIKGNGLENIKMDSILKGNINYLAFDDLQEQSMALAEKIIDILSQAIINKGSASIAVSGGSTPKALFNILSNSTLDWEKVTVTLVDDRWLAPNHPDSNQHLVEQQLLQNKAVNARFVGLYQADKGLADTIDFLNTQQPESSFDVLLLGMGNDGHTASLFPCSTQLKHG
jgi:6-phosphogluconolactonase